jgi:rRNA maturation protein Nop10
MKKTVAAAHYRSFILVCWRDEGEETAVSAPWRFSLEDPHTGRRYGFADQSELIAFLQKELTKKQ